MKNSLFAVLAIVALATACQECPRTDAEQLLAIHERLLQVHRDRDAEAFTATEADTTIFVGGGEISRSGRSERLAARERYFATTRFSRYRDLQPPIVKVSDDGSLGWVIANVEVISHPTAGVANDSMHTIWAWIELYERAADGWVLIGNVSNERPGAAEVPALDASAILLAAQRSLGSVAAVDGFETLRAQAHVQGPDMEFETTVWSARDGRARLEQTGGTVLGSHPSGNWRIDPTTGDSEPMDAQMLGFLRGHELHAAMLVPKSRFREPQFEGQVEFAGLEASAIAMTDGLGERVVAYYALDDAEPLGFLFTHTDPDVVVTLSDWQDFDGLRLFTRATFTQGVEQFHYEYTDIQLNQVTDGMFLPSGGSAKEDR